MIVVAGGGQRIRVIDEAGSRGRMNSQVSACLFVCVESALARSSKQWHPFRARVSDGLGSLGCGLSALPRVVAVLPRWGSEI